MSEFDAAIKVLGDQIVGLTLLQAKSLADYLKEVHGIEAAGGRAAGNLLFEDLGPGGTIGFWGSLVGFLEVAE